MRDAHNLDILDIAASLDTVYEVLHILKMEREFHLWGERPCFQLQAYICMGSP